jgi:hypothetical protein
LERGGLNLFDSSGHIIICQPFRPFAVKPSYWLVVSEGEYKKRSDFCRFHCRIDDPFVWMDEVFLYLAYFALHLGISVVLPSFRGVFYDS